MMHSSGMTGASAIVGTGGVSGGGIRLVLVVMAITPDPDTEAPLRVLTRRLWALLQVTVAWTWKGLVGTTMKAGLAVDSERY